MEDEGKLNLEKAFDKFYADAASSQNAAAVTMMSEENINLTCDE